jgi:hypothetical protein
MSVGTQGASAESGRLRQPCALATTDFRLSIADWRFFTTKDTKGTKDFRLWIADWGFFTTKGTKGLYS